MKKIDSFINIFRDLSHSGHSLSRKERINELTNALKEKIEKLVNRIGKEDYPIHEVIEEIEDQLSQHNQTKVLILRTLRKFTDISPYLLIHIKKEKTEEYGLKTLKIGNTSYSEGHFFSHKTLERYCNWEQPRLDYFEANVYEKYIIQCFDLFNRFFNQLDKLCLDYDLDIIKIQEENGIIVWIRNLHQLLGFGYDKKLGEIITFPYQHPKMEANLDLEDKNPKQKLDLKETGLQEKIKKHFKFFGQNCPRKHKQILKDEDFNRLIDWTIEYFEKDFIVPKISEPIKVINTNKTFVQAAFKYLFKELHKNSPYPDTLFEFYKSAFTPYSEDKQSNFIAVKNNEEVKKLMQIDH